MSAFSNLKLRERITISNHALKRWKKRFNDKDDKVICEKIHQIVRKGTHIDEGDGITKIVDGSMCLIAKQLTPLRKMILTVYRI